MLAGGGSVGLILSPWLVSRVERSGRPIAAAAARVAAVGALSNQALSTSGDYQKFFTNAQGLHSRPHQPEIISENLSGPRSQLVSFPQPG